MSGAEMFETVNPKRDFIELEHEVLRFWESGQIFRKRMEMNHGRTPWSFIDGPMTANNPMGVHHAWGRTYKDVFQRYRAMCGFDQRYQNGFDCQGLWLEVETEKDLGFNSKRDIENYGLDKFSRACRSRVEKFSAVQSDQSIRLGQWMRWDDSYYTMTDGNIEAIWHFLRICREKGWLYSGAKAMPWCTRCGTSLSQHELSDGYEDIDDTSVFLAFPLRDRPGEALLVWTTTPWTLTSNVAAAVNPDLEYARVKRGDQIYYLSAGLASTIFNKDAEILGTVKGSEMVGWIYEGPFDDLPVIQGMEHRIIPWEEVGETEGSGIVHIAPGCGAEDNELGRIHGLQVIVPLDGDGRYVNGFGWLTGMYVHEVEKPILRKLKEKGVFFRQETYRHRYPFCWRCKEKLIFRVEDEWFIACDEIRPLMKQAADTVQWIPESVGKRTQDWYKNMGDWCISRKRFWGLPLPFYFCPDGHLTVVGSRAELRERAENPAEVDALPELHRPWIDSITIRCSECGKTAKRTLDVGDCWLDAGIVAFSTLRYFEDRAYWEKWFPAEVVIEMREQVRLWFYAMMFMSVTLEGRAPYKRVFSYEKVHDEKGLPMHKSTGNAIWFDEAVEKMGADVMRWVYCAFNPNNNLRFGFHVADEIRRRLITLWNVYGFFVTYARLDGFEPCEVDDPAVLKESPSPLDIWILSALYKTLDEVTQGLEEYDTAGSLRAVDGFLEALSTWYLRRSRRRFWKSADGEDADKQFAYRTLHHVLITLCEILAPITPFVTEEIYRNLSAPLRAANASGWPESVHLRDWPRPRPEMIDQAMNDRMDKVLAAVSLGRAAREKVQIKVRQPLGRIWILDPGGESLNIDADLCSQIAQELNVKAVLLEGKVDELVRRELKLNFPVLGARLGPAMKDVSSAAKEGAWELAGDGRVRLADQVLAAGEYELRYAGRDGLIATNDHDLLVVLDTQLTEDLRFEGYAREMVRTIQDLRKKADYNVEDRITVFYSGEDPRVGKTLERHGVYVSEETLAREIVPKREDSDQVAEVDLGDGIRVWVGVRKG